MRLLPSLAAALLLGACSMPSGNAIRDLAAIHDPSDWSPRSPAAMTVPPGAYQGGLVDRVSGSGIYEIHDHRQLELALLDHVAGVSPDVEGKTLEASAWLLTLLLADDHAEARLRSAKILSGFAGHWVSKMDVRLPELLTDGDLEAAVLLLGSAEDEEEFDAAVAALNRAAIPDAVTGVRVLTGLARTAPRYANIDQRDLPVFTFALRVVLLGLQEAGTDADATVAAACAERAELLLEYGNRR